MNYTPTMRDYLLEADMQVELKLYQEANTRESKLRHWRKYRRLHARRSPGMVAYLEAQRGLR